MSTPSRILLLEDNADDATLIRELLRTDFGSRTIVDHAPTTAAADELINGDANYDLILVDYMLDENTNGAEWVSNTAAKRNMPPVIMLTGLPDAARIEAVAGKMPEISYFVTKKRLHTTLPRAIHSAMVNRPALRASDGVILLADDDADDILLVEDALREVEGHYHLDTVHDGIEMLDYLRRKGDYVHLKGAMLPGLVLLDLNMPRMDGREVLRELRDDPALHRIPIVVLSTSDADRDVLDGYNMGANSFICKPSTFEDLVNMMRTLTNYWFRLVSLPTRHA